MVRFLTGDSGSTAMEYGLIAMLLAIGILVAVTGFGGSLSGLFGSVSNKSSNAMSGG